MPPAVVARALALQIEWQKRGAPSVAQLLRDQSLLEVHKAMLPPPRRPRLDPIDPVLVQARAKLDEAETLQDALSVLQIPELTAILSNAAALETLRALAAARPA